MSDNTLRIAFDIGGAISRYPDVFRRLIGILQFSEGLNRGVETHIISDMHPLEKIKQTLEMNGLHFADDRIHSADYTRFGDECKAVVCEEQSIDVLIDDHMAYVSVSGSPLVRLFVMPDAGLDYYDASWKTDGSEGNFGRRRNPTCSKRSPEQL